MSRIELSDEEHKLVMNSIKDAIDSLLMVHVTYALTDRQIKSSEENWREMEMELHAAQYPVRALGLSATKKNLNIVNAKDGGYLHFEQLVAPEEIVEQLGAFPLEAATASYAFSIMEVCGDEIATLLNPAYMNKSRSWHSNVSGEFAKLNSQAIEANKKRFAEPFRADASNVSTTSIQRLLDMKVARNDFIHRGTNNITLHLFLAYCIGVLCEIHFLCLPEHPQLIAFPWSSIDPKWLGV